MVPILILFASKDGQTKKIANVVAEVLRGEGVDVDVRDAAGQVERLRPEVYAGVVVAAPVRAGRYPRQDWTRDFEYTDWDDLRAFAHAFQELVDGPRAKAAAG